ncbi:peptidyl-prolyl cis-trans isomerase, FKBP-type [Ostreococcus lucimarinus CCE9901]|uniref:peptidylprolyl isomerase n=1 Tax=Ostreococcus lucimarinus (strain CCE9901) TaxID=436017 RepID=A4S9B3_OSTLU|nr:peptidyl-prolyl cis-trans isomerase, FKBP-type [Ostreococcus lucimarinus CCE9901]ABP00327.1 peptidyl-prolyl cis-trans isomerase, FKBP-type [Ostreococcus lucimarinus CCE9901]|eukprot:XP_001422033.1 peptidyl-prolyl cis-trans isomerase, FKBP-type [Ostreococcus lucimarinus CCE9901]
MKTRPRASASASSDVARRRDALVGAALALVATPGAARAKLSGGVTGGVPIENFQPIPGTNPPILYYDLQGASGATGGVPKGARVAVHYDLKFRSVTVGTSRQGAGVTGGTPIGFTVGQPAGEPGGPFIQAFNEGIKGMGVGTVRRMIVPPEYAYGPNEVMEIPANGTVTLDLELLSVAKDPITRGVKGAQE